MKEILLAFLGFAFGIVATMFTQLVSRRFRFSDARRGQKLDNLQFIRVWMDAYHALSECEFPDIHTELQYVPSIEGVRIDNANRKHVYHVLKKFREASIKCDEAERMGRYALLALGENEWLDKLTYPIHLLYILLGGYEPYPRNWRIRHNTVRAIQLSLQSWYSNYPRGFPRRIAPNLEALYRWRRVVFKAPESVAFSINWPKLDFVEPDEIELVVQYAPAPKDDKAWEAIDRSESQRGLVKIPIERVIREVIKEEKKWLIPGSRTDT